MKSLLFRADGNAQIGLGHVMRCLALADMLGDTYQRRFAIVQPAPDVVRLIDGKDVVVVPLLTNDVADFLAVATPDDVVVLDGYAFDATYQRAVRQRAKKLVYIDDLVVGHPTADVVVNHAGGVRPNDYQDGPHTTFCLGPHYALLRPEFMRPGGFAPYADTGTIFVCLGGADPHNVTLTVLETLRISSPQTVVQVVLGPFHPARLAIEALGAQMPNLSILQNLNAPEMIRALEQCSLAVTSCSTVAYEVCAVNRPLIAIVTADNQSRIAQFFVQEKLALSVLYPAILRELSDPDSFQKMLGASINALDVMPGYVAETLANQRRYFDGRSPERFRALFGQLCH